MVFGGRLEEATWVRGAACDIGVVFWGRDLEVRAEEEALFEEREVALFDFRVRWVPSLEICLEDMADFEFKFEVEAWI